MVGVKDIIKLLSEMKGTVGAFQLDNGCRQEILDIEKEIKAAMLIPCINVGVEECLKRTYVFAIIKNKDFRPPPEATVVLYSDDGTVSGGGDIITHQEGGSYLKRTKSEINRLLRRVRNAVT
jgi:hypothetical protein